MKHTKKTITLLLLTLLLSSLTACNSSSTVNKNNDSISENETTISAQKQALEGTAIEIIDKIYEQKEVDLMLNTTEVDLTNSDSLKYYTGLDSADSIKEVAVSEAMITSQAYSLVVVRTNDKEKTTDIAKQILDGINQYKWICVGAEDLQVVTYEDVIVLIMVSTAFEDTLTSNDIVTAFETVCGSELDEKLQK